MIVFILKWGMGELVCGFTPVLSKAMKREQDDSTDVIREEEYVDIVTVQRLLQHEEQQQEIPLGSEQVTSSHLEQGTTSSTIGASSVLVPGVESDSRLCGGDNDVGQLAHPHQSQVQESAGILHQPSTSPSLSGSNQQHLSHPYYQYHPNAHQQSHHDDWFTLWINNNTGLQTG